MTPETVVVTGASSGIGVELAKCFAADKSNLVLVARSGDKLAALAADLHARFGVEARSIVLDLARPEAPKELEEDLARAGLVVDVLVNNAGFATPGASAHQPLYIQLDLAQH